MRSSLSLGVLIVAIACLSCAKKKEEKANAEAKMRSVGTEDLSIALKTDTSGVSLAPVGATYVGNSAVTLEYFKVPVSRINLVAGITGSGYTEASQDFYSCPYTTDEECLVDLTKKVDIDNLLQGGGSKEMVVEGDKTYDGVAVEFCHEFSSQKVGQGEGYFHARIKGTVKLGDITYYTNAASGLSASGPAEDVKTLFQGAGCGMTTHLQESIVLGPDKTVNIVLYAEPNGAVFATNAKTLANSHCVGEDALAICSDMVPIFGTVDTVAPTVERYHLQPGQGYTDIFVSVLFDSGDNPFGATMNHLYLNDARYKTLHGGYNFAEIDKASDGSLTFSSLTTTGTGPEVMKNFTRGDHSGSIMQLVDEAPLAYTAEKL